MLNKITLRTEEQTDLNFIESLYLQSRDYEMAGTQYLPEAAVNQFLSQQFYMQNQHFIKTYPDLHRKVIMSGSKPIGRLYTALISKGANLHLVDITLNRKQRNNGVGTRILAELQASLTEKCPLMSLYVIKFNPARQFYLRMGFQEVKVQDSHIYMEYEKNKGG